MDEEQMRPHPPRGKTVLLAAATAGGVAVLATYLLEYLTPLTSSPAALILGMAAGIIVGRQHARHHDEGR